MARQIEDLTESEKDDILKAIFKVMYDDSDGLVEVLNSNKEVNGGDLVDTVSALFDNYDVAPREEWTPRRGIN